MRRAALALALLITIPAHAGPPFQTDDPDPVNFHHFEMYAFSLSDSTGKNAGGTVLEIPAYEVNYGAAPGLQIHLVVPPQAIFQPMGGPTNYGIGDTELGFKYRLFKETPHSPEIAIFPFFEFPTGNADKGLGVGKTWYRLPLWLQKSWGSKDTSWTSYGGGGEAVVPQDGYVNYPFAGWLVQRQFNKKISLGAELFGHGAEGPAALSTDPSTMLDLGGIYEFHEGFDLLFAAGRSIHGQPETYTYLSLYWTWGPKDADASAAPPDGSKTSKMLNAMSRIHL
ncbi:MAG: transporter [Acidobacteriota bacterium]|nr:transporter [Acidobacteriota bacterium]